MRRAARIVAIYGALGAGSRHDAEGGSDRGDLRGAGGWKLPRCGARLRSWRSAGRWGLEVATMRRAARIVAIYGALGAGSCHDVGLGSDRGDLRGAGRWKSPRCGGRLGSWRIAGRWGLEVATMWGSAQIVANCGGWALEVATMWGSAWIVAIYGALGLATGCGATVIVVNVGAGRCRRRDVEGGPGTKRNHSGAGSPRVRRWWFSCSAGWRRGCGDPWVLPGHRDGAGTWVDRVGMPGCQGHRWRPLATRDGETRREVASVMCKTAAAGRFITLKRANRWPGCWWAAWTANACEVAVGVAV